MMVDQLSHGAKLQTDVQVQTARYEIMGRFLSSRRGTLHSGIKAACFLNAIGGVRWNAEQNLLAWYFRATGLDGEYVLKWQVSGPERRAAIAAAMCLEVAA